MAGGGREPADSEREDSGAKIAEIKEQLITSKVQQPPLCGYNLLAGGTTGEFRQQVNRLLSEVEKKGKESLDKYLAGIPNFLAFRQRSGDFFSSKDPMVFTPENIYLPAILSIAAINHGYRQLFLAAEKRLLILPPCIRKMEESSCQAKAIKSLYITHCAHCQPDCYIHLITGWAEARGVRTFIAPDKMEKSFRSLKKRYGSVGIVGVACFMDLLVGMLKCMELGLAPQGVPLIANRCDRWSGEELLSALDVGWLSEVLDLPDPPKLGIMDGEREELRKERG